MTDFCSGAAAAPAGTDLPPPCQFNLPPPCQFNLLPALLAMPTEPEHDLSLLQWLDARIGGTPSEPYFAQEPWPEPSEPAAWSPQRRRCADLGRWPVGRR